MATGFMTNVTYGLSASEKEDQHWPLWSLEEWSLKDYQSTYIRCVIVVFICETCSVISLQSYIIVIFNLRLDCVVLDNIQQSMRELIVIKTLSLYMDLITGSNFSTVVLRYVCVVQLCMSV